MAAKKTAVVKSASAASAPGAYGLMNIKLSLDVVTAYGRLSLFSSLDSFDFRYQKEPQWLTIQMELGDKLRGADKRVLGAVYNAIVSIRRLDIKIEASLATSEAAPTLAPAQASPDPSSVAPVAGAHQEGPAAALGDQGGVGGQGMINGNDGVDSMSDKEVGARRGLGELDDQAELNYGHPQAETERRPPRAGESPAAVLKALSLYFVALSSSEFSGFAPRAMGVLSDILTGKGGGAPSAEELIRRYSMAKSRAVVDLKMMGNPAAELIDSVHSTQQEVLNLERKMGPSPFEGAASLAPESVGASLEERVVVFQLAKNVVSEQKMQTFLCGYRGKGIYFRPLENFTEGWRSMYQRRLQKKGFLEFTLLVSAGIDYKQVVDCMLESGALKREVLHQREIGYNDMPPGKSVRISEWYKRPNGIYRSVLDSRTERLPTYLAVVDHAY